MHVTIHPAYAHLSEFIRQLPARFEQEGTTIYEGRNRIKTFEVDGLVLNVKRYRKPAFLNRCIYSWFRSPKARRAYEYALRLLEKEVETPFPIAYLLCEEGGLLSWSYFISTQVPSAYQTLYAVGQQPLEGNEDIFRALGTFTAQLHQKEIYHKDYSPGNILYLREGTAVRFVLIDINRMSFGPVSLRKGCANFARIWGCTAAFHLLAESYADTLRVDRAQCLRWVLQARERFWRRYAKKHPVKFKM